MKAIIWSQEVRYLLRERNKVCVYLSVCVLMCACVHACVCVCIGMTAFRAAALDRLIRSHLRSSVRIIKPISRWWLLQPACDWMATLPLPSDVQRERVRDEKNETLWKKEMRKEINKDSHGQQSSGGWMRKGEKETASAWDQDPQYFPSASSLHIIFKTTGTKKHPKCSRDCLPVLNLFSAKVFFPQHLSLLSQHNPSLGVVYRCLYAATVIYKIS